MLDDGDLIVSGIIGLAAFIACGIDIGRAYGILLAIFWSIVALHIIVWVPWGGFIVAMLAYSASPSIRNRSSADIRTG
jgi:hypothetical protein